jgi:hypothetical protein
MKALLVILFLSSTLNAIGQNINDSLLATFYNTVLDSSFRKDGISCGNSPLNNYLVKTDFDTSRLIKRLGWDRITFYKNDASLRGLLL